MEKEDLWKLHSLTADWIKVADSKAMLVVGVIGIISTIFASLTNLTLHELMYDNLTATLILSSGFYTVISILSAIYSLYSQIQNSSNKSKIFFNDIAAHKNFKTYTASHTPDYKIDDDLKSQIYIISKIATQKHVLLQWSIAFLGLAILFIASCILITVLN